MKDRKLLMIPGPIEFTPAVLQAMGLPTTSHVAGNFIEVFGKVLERLRDVFMCPDGQPFVLAGSGTLAMDTVAANLIEPGEKALVVNSGYFGDRYATILQRYGAVVTNLKALAVGDVPSLEVVERELQSGTYALMTITHVDTSTAVKTDVQNLAKLGRQYNVLVVVDGVCSIAGEELRQREWGVDVALTASQKAIGVPPGLALLVAGPRAMAKFHARKSPVGNYYADWTEWLPIMQAYEARKPSYFGTPAVNLIWALNTSLEEILREGMEPRFTRHRRLAAAFKAGVEALGLHQLPVSSDKSANTLSALYYPEGVDATLVKGVLDAGVIIAGGLLPGVKEKYFRVGHMGAVTTADIISTLGAIELALQRTTYRFSPGAVVRAAQERLM